MGKISILLFMFLIIFVGGCSCNKDDTVAQAILEIGNTEEDNSKKYDLDERFSYFQLFSANGEGMLHLNNEEGIISMIFDTKENEDGSVECTLKEIYLVNYGTIAMGWLTREESIKNAIGNDIVFTLVLDDNIVTTYDLPQLLPLQ